MLCEICFKPYLTRWSLVKHVNGTHPVQASPAQRVYRRTRNPVGDGDILILDTITDAQLLRHVQLNPSFAMPTRRSQSTSNLAPSQSSPPIPSSSRTRSNPSQPLRPARSLPAIVALPPARTSVSARRATTHNAYPANGSSASTGHSSGSTRTDGDDVEDDEGGLSEPFDKLRRVAVLPTTFKRVPLPHAPAFQDAAGRCAQTFLDNQDDASLVDFMCLPKVGLASGLRRRCVGPRLTAYPNVDFPLPDDTSRMTRPPVESATRLVQEGRLSAAMSGEGDSTVLDVNDDVLAALRSKHPEGEAHPFEGIPAPLGRRAIESPTADDILAAIRTFRRDTAPGISGWTVPLLLLACKDERVAKMLVFLTEGILRGTAPGKQLLCASRLTPLAKGVGGVRPIAVGDLLLRVAEKAIMRAAFDPQSLLPIQSGVGTSTDPPVRLVCEALKGDLGPSFTHLAALDAINAFNQTKRSHIARAINRYTPHVFDMARWLYGSPTALVVRDGKSTIVMSSSEGVKQGDVVASWFFSMALRDFLTDLQTHLGPNHIVVAYLDDIYILGPDGGILERLHEYMRTHPTPITLNPDKCKLRSLEDIKVNGMEMLGSILGPPSAIRAFLRHKIDAYRDTLHHHLPLLPTQHALLLLRTVVLPRIRYLLRSLPPRDTKELWREVDKLTREAVDRLRWRGCPEGREDIDTALISLPLKFGGLGLNSLLDISPHAYAAATEAADATLSAFIPSIPSPSDHLSQRERCQLMYTDQQSALFANLSVAEKLVVYEGTSAIGRRFLTLIPHDYQLLLGDADLAAALRHRTLMSLCCDICMACSAPNPNVLHADSCMRSQWIRTGRHECVKYALGRALESFKNSTVDYEPLIHYADRAQHPVRFNDVRFSGHSGAQLPPMEFDISVTSLVGVQPLSRPLPQNENPLIAAKLHAERTLTDLSNIKRKKLPQMILPGATFYPFILSAGGLMHSETLNIWNRIARKLSPGVASFATDITSVGLVKRRVKAILATEGARSYERAGDRRDEAASSGRGESGGDGMGGGRPACREIGEGEGSASQEERFLNDGGDEVVGGQGGARRVFEQGVARVFEQGDVARVFELGDRLEGEVSL